VSPVLSVRGIRQTTPTNTGAKSGVFNWHKKPTQHQGQPGAVLVYASAWADLWGARTARGKVGVGVSSGECAVRSWDDCTTQESLSVWDRPAESQCGELALLWLRTAIMGYTCGNMWVDFENGL